MYQSVPANPTVIQAEVVYGINIPDPGAARLTRKVLWISVVLMFFVVGISCYFTVGNPMVSGFSSTFFVNIGFGLLIPLCGYFGARDKNKTLLTCFWCCNLCTLIGLGSALGFIYSIIIPVLSQAQDYCSSHPSEIDPTIVVDGQNITVHASCEAINSMNTSYFHSMGYLYVLPMVLSFMGCCYGYRLANHRYYTTTYARGHTATFVPSMPQPIARTSAFYGTTTTTYEPPIAATVAAVPNYPAAGYPAVPIVKAV